MCNGMNQETKDELLKLAAIINVNQAEAKAHIDSPDEADYNKTFWRGQYAAQSGVMSYLENLGLETWRVEAAPAFKEGSYATCIHGLEDELTEGGHYIVLGIGHDCAIRTMNDRNERRYYNARRFGPYTGLDKDAEPEVETETVDEDVERRR